MLVWFFLFFQAEDGIRDDLVTGVQTCALPISSAGSAPRRGLGRGFEVLIGAGEPELARLPVDQIHPNAKQPRKRFDDEAVSGLAEAIRAQGLIQPVVVRPRLEGGDELIA